MNELELGHWFRTGDDAAVRAVYERFGGAIHTLTLSALGDRQLAAEAVQLTFIKAWRGSSDFDASRPLAPWLYTIARRVAIDLWRREASRPALVVDPAVEPRVEAEDFERAWETWEIRRALDQLEPDEREVMRLSHFEGLSHTDIASRVGVPIGTVKSRSHRAHRRLAALLDHLIDREGAASELVREQP